MYERTYIPMFIQKGTYIARQEDPRALVRTYARMCGRMHIEVCSKKSKYKKKK